MKASLCVGEYCENAYNVEGLDIRVYSMEELCYCLKANAFLLDLYIMNDKLVDWIGEECKVWELAKQLYPMVHKQGSLSVYVVTILQYVGMYDPEEILALQLLTGKNASENQCGSHGEHSNHDNQQQHVLHGTDKVRILHQHLEILHTDKDFVGVEGAPLIQRQTEYLEGGHCHENDEQNHSRCHAREDKSGALEIAFHLEPTP